MQAVNEKFDASIVVNFLSQLIFVFVFVFFWGGGVDGSVC